MRRDQANRFVVSHKVLQNILPRDRTQNRIPLLLVALATDPNLSISRASYKQTMVLKRWPKALPLPVPPPTSTASHNLSLIFGGFPMRPSRRAPDELRAVSLAVSYTHLRAHETRH